MGCTLVQQVSPKLVEFKIAYFLSLLYIHQRILLPINTIHRSLYIRLSLALGFMTITVTNK